MNEISIFFPRWFLHRDTKQKSEQTRWCLLIFKPSKWYKLQFYYFLLLSGARSQFPDYFHGKKWNLTILKSLWKMHSLLESGCILMNTAVINLRFATQALNQGTNPTSLILAYESFEGWLQKKTIATRQRKFMGELSSFLCSFVTMNHNIVSSCNNVYWNCKLFWKLALLIYINYSSVASPHFAILSKFHS